MVSSVILSIFFTIIGILFTDTLLSFIKIPLELYKDAKLYVLIYFIGFTFRTTFGVNDAIFIAMGDSKKNLVFLVIGNIVNIFLDIILIAFLRLGVISVAAAVIFSQMIMCFMSYKMLITSFERLKISIFVKEGFFRIDYFLSIIKLMIPSILLTGLPVIGSIILQIKINVFDTSVISAYGIVTKIEIIITIFTVSMMNAMVSFTGQNIGANKINRINKAFFESSTTGFIITSVVSLFTYIFANEVVMLFVGSKVNTDTINLAVGNLKICAPFFPLYSIIYTAQGIFRGASDMMGAISGITAIHITKVLVSYFLLESMGVTAIWISIPLSILAGAIYSYVIYKIGFWRNSAIIEESANIYETENKLTV